MFKNKTTDRKAGHMSFLVGEEALARVHWVMRRYKVNRTTAAEMLLNGAVDVPSTEEIAPIIKEIRAERED